MVDLSTQILAKRTRILAGGIAVLLVVGFILWGEEPGFVEVERLKAYERHAERSERNREYFEERYQRLSPELKTKGAIFQALGLPQPASVAPHVDGGQAASIALPDKYSRLILVWDAAGEVREFDWKIDSPASDQASWQQHLDSFDVSE